ncbi:MAG TPA: hypothetical protein VL225_05855 [Vicinamibacterales bacterium]|nr:hypothetical protein [Vicinamibacterales bacterium]
MRRKLAMTAAIVVALAAAGYAQKPDFSGTWTPDVAADTTTTTPPAGGGGGGRGGGGPMTVKQTADALSIERTMGGNPVTTTYKLDGTETEVPAGRGGTGKATAKWDGSKLVITTKTDNGETTQTWSLADGKLTIERTGGRGPSKTVYKKTT